MCCVWQLCLMVRAHIWTVLAVGLGFFRFQFVSLCVFAILCLCCLVFSVRFSLFSLLSTMPRDWLGRTSPKWPVLYGVGLKTLTQSVKPVFCRFVVVTENKAERCWERKTWCDFCCQSRGTMRCVWVTTVQNICTYMCVEKMLVGWGDYITLPCGRSIRGTNTVVGENTENGLLTSCFWDLFARK